MAGIEVTRPATKAQPVPAARRRRRPDYLMLLALPAVVIVLLLFVYPFAYAIGLSFQPYKATAWGMLGSYALFFGDHRDVATIGITLRLAVPATLINLLLATPLAYRMRRPLPGHRLITTLVAMPMTLGTVLIAQGMIEFFAPSGWANKVLAAVHLPQLSVLYNYTGVLISLTIAEFPVVFLIMVGYASGLDPNLERAARMLGAGALRRFQRITLPLLLPGMAVAAAVSFVATFSVFPSAILVGQPASQTRVIAIAAFEAYSQRADYSEASAIAVVMALIELIFVALVLLVRSRAYRGPTIGGRG